MIEGRRRSARVDTAKSFIRKAGDNLFNLDNLFGSHARIPLASADCGDTYDFARAYAIWPKKVVKVGDVDTSQSNQPVAHADLFATSSTSTAATLA